MKDATLNPSERPAAVFRLSPTDLQNLTGAPVHDVTEPPSPP
jgi:hypothetical protein